MSSFPHTIRCYSSEKPINSDVKGIIQQQGLKFLALSKRQRTFGASACVASGEQWKIIDSLLAYVRGEGGKRRLDDLEIWFTDSIKIAPTLSVIATGSKTVE